MRTEPCKASRRNVEGTSQSLVVLRTSHSSKIFFAFYQVLRNKRKQP